MINKTNTYVNPISLPSMPIGRYAHRDHPEVSWREVADPTVIYEGGKWYLYPSCDMAWVSEDFCTWKYHPLSDGDVGYAPTVVKHKGKFLLAASMSPLYISDDPLGPFTEVGRFKFSNGEDIGKYYDPMIFSDDDERLYIYYCIWDPEKHSTVIFGAELDSDEPTHFICDPVRLIDFDPSHKWECNGPNNEDENSSAIEGAWMYKKNGIYYLVYTAPGTEYPTYALGAYRSTKPLSDFTYMETSPFTRKTEGVVKGAGHGCLVDGPCGTTWAFYTSVICNKHKFERMIGYDRIYFDDNGDIMPSEVTDIPCYSPLSDKRKTGLSPVVIVRWQSSSVAAGCKAENASSDDLTKWWQAGEGDTCPTITFGFSAPCDVYSFRIIWNEVGLSVGREVLGGAFGYKVELISEDGSAVKVFEIGADREVRSAEYETVNTTRAVAARLTVTETPRGITAGVYNMTFFGIKNIT